ncbi:MAG: 6,7-dimethyl-8-ribityllumazine synthase [Acidiferrobacterales bacterium]|nr:6,7-dimethyl-8-ribityllumazine synthase [Acidiferrobacterales bacterium]
MANGEHKSVSRSGLAFGIVVSNYYPAISDRLLSGALNVLESHSINSEVCHVDGAWEVPFVTRVMVGSGNYQGMIALGCVIRGETAHFDYLCDHSARALMDISMEFTIPVGFGILTVENEEQATARSQLRGRNPRNKGSEAAQAVISAIDAVSSG